MKMNETKMNEDLQHSAENIRIILSAASRQAKTKKEHLLFLVEVEGSINKYKEDYI